MNDQCLVASVVGAISCLMLTTCHGAAPPPSYLAKAVIRRGVSAHGGIKALQQFAKVKCRQIEKMYHPMTGKCIMKIEAEMVAWLPDRCLVRRTFKEPDGRLVGTSGHSLDGERGWRFEDKKARECTKIELRHIKNSLNRQRWILLLYPMLSDPKLHLTVQGETVVEKELCVGIHVAVVDQSPFVLYFSASSGRLRKVRIEGATYLGKRESCEIVLTDFKTINGGLYPLRGYEVRSRGRITFHKTKIEVNPRVDPSTFRPMKP